MASIRVDGVNVAADRATVVPGGGLCGVAAYEREIIDIQLALTVPFASRDTRTMHAIEFIARVAPNMPDMFAVVTVRASVS